MTWLLPILVLVTYVGAGLIFYTQAEEWEWYEAMYFTMATCSTVGYGDYSVDSFWSRAFTVFMILAGIALVFPLAGGMLARFVSPLTERGRGVLDRWFPERAIDIDGDGEADYKLPHHPFLYFGKNLLPSFLLNVVVQFPAAVIFASIEEWPLSTSMYHCLVTASTVGYGDVTIATPRGMIFASCHMLFAVVLWAELLGSINTLYMERQSKLLRATQLQKRLEPGLFGRLMGHAVRLRPNVQRDGLGLTELEYALAMLMELEIVTWEQVRPFVRHFRRLDLDSDGRLGTRDVAALLQLKPDEVLALQRTNTRRLRAHGVSVHGGCATPPSRPAWQ